MMVTSSTVSIPCEDCGRKAYTHYLRSDGKWVCHNCIPEAERKALLGTSNAKPEEPWFRQILETLMYGLELLHKRLLGGKNAR